MDDSTSTVNRRVESMVSVLHHEGERNPSRKKSEEHAAPETAISHEPEEVKDNIDDLSAAITLANDFLRERNSPYSLGITLDGNDILLEISFTGHDGMEHSIVKKDITHEDFIRFVSHVTGGEGLFYDNRI